MGAAINQIYINYFNSTEQADVTWSDVTWSKFTNVAMEDVDFSKRECDYSIDDRTWKDTAKKVLLFLAKTVIVPWGLVEISRYILQRLTMILIYPVTWFPVDGIMANIARKLFGFDINIHKGRKELLSVCDNPIRSCVRRHVVLEKNGVRYSGMILGDKNTITNGKWIICALGNCMIMEEKRRTEEISEWHQENGYNTLIINGPDVGLSQGTATLETIGEAQELGIRFLEEAVRAKQIVLAGFSLGGAAISQAILQHEFKENVQYFVCRAMTFDSATNVVAGRVFPGIENRICKIFTFIVRTYLRFVRCDMAVAIEASKKLKEKNIQEIIIQGSDEFRNNLTKAYEKKEANTSFFPLKIQEEIASDEVIPKKGSLAYRIFAEGMNENKNISLYQNYPCHHHHGSIEIFFKIGQLISQKIFKEEPEVVSAI